LKASAIISDTIPCTRLCLEELNCSALESNSVAKINKKTSLENVDNKEIKIELNLISVQV
jgi:hypothetical protein